MLMTCHDGTSTALVFAITLSVAIEPNSRARQVDAATPRLLFVPCSFCRKPENSSGDILGAFQSRVASW